MLMYAQGSKINLKDKRWPQGGTATFGSGIVSGEAIQATSKHGRFLAMGWASTVGVVGWSLGGGHGPFTGAAGIGSLCMVVYKVSGETIGAIVEQLGARGAAASRPGPGGPAVQAQAPRRFLMPLGEAEFALTTALEELQRDAYPVAPSHRPLRCTGTALQVLRGESDGFSGTTGLGCV